MPPGLIVAGELGVGTEAALKTKKMLGHEYSVIHRLLQTPDFLLGKYPKDATQLNEIEQRKALEDIWSTLLSNTHVRFQLIPRVNKMFWQLYQKTLDVGGEGIVLKNTSNTHEVYTPGSYCQSWIKIKKTVTVDMVLMEVFDSSSKTFQNSSLAGAILCGMYDSKGVLNPLTRIGTMDHSIRHHLYVNRASCVGKVVELGCYEQFASGALRHPWFIRFREDKNPEECVLVRGIPL